MSDPALDLEPADYEPTETLHIPHVLDRAFGVCGLALGPGVGTLHETIHVGAVSAAQWRFMVTKGKACEDCQSIAESVAFRRSAHVVTKA